MNAYYKKRIVDIQCEIQKKHIDYDDLLQLYNILDDEIAREKTKLLMDKTKIEILLMEVEITELQRVK